VRHLGVVLGMLAGRQLEVEIVQQREVEVVARKMVHIVTWKIVRGLEVVRLRAEGGPLGAEGHLLE